MKQRHTAEYETQLGMTLSKAVHRLKKKVLFDLAERLGLLTCFRCAEPIRNPPDLSIDHKAPWRHVSAGLFWDLDNIGFSHRSCNKADRPNTQAMRIKHPAGKHWCSKHRAFLLVAAFTRSGLNDNKCAECKVAHNRRRYTKWKESGKGRTYQDFLAYKRNWYATKTAQGVSGNMPPS